MGTDATRCSVCGGEFSAVRTIIGNRAMHPGCSIMSHGTHTSDDMADATNLIWELRTALQKIVARNKDGIASAALRKLFPNDSERDRHFISQYEQTK